MNESALDDYRLRLEALHSIPLEHAEKLRDGLIEDRRGVDLSLIAVEQIIAQHDGRSAYGAYCDARFRSR